MMAALKSGSIEAAVLNPEFATLANRDGFTNLVDIGALGLAFPASSLNTSRTFVRQNRDVVRRFIRSYVEGIHYAKTNREFSIGVLKKYLKNDDVKFLNSIYDIYISRFIPKIPYPSTDAMKTVLAQMGDKDPRARSAQPEQFVDSTFMQDLEKEGFIQQLWK
jgi:ABC-type nitrate/sulfonate/bicarbonate transport system substrate-binding protein